MDIRPHHLVKERLDLVGETYGLGCSLCAAAKNNQEFVKLGFFKNVGPDTVGFHNHSVTASAASGLKVQRMIIHQKKSGHLAALNIVASKGLADGTLAPTEAAWKEVSLSSVQARCSGSQMFDWHSDLHARNKGGSEVLD